MIRKSALPEILYREEFPPAEDYDLWVRIACKYKVWNLSDVLTYYRIHFSNISKIKAKKMTAAEKKILQWQLEELKVNFAKEDLDIYYSLGKYSFGVSAEYLRKVKKSLLNLKIANELSKKFDKMI